MSDMRSEHNDNPSQLVGALTPSENAPKQWKSVESLFDDPQVRAQFQSEIEKKVPTHFLSRREFMGWLGGVSAVMSASSCTRQPSELILPYKEQPEEIVPGKPLYFATSRIHHGAAVGLLAESHMGRPTKVDGNPDHATGGGSDVFTQASILNLYDPDRSRGITQRGVASSWHSFTQALTKKMDGQAADQGERVRILTEAVVSPSYADQIRQFLKKYPKATWHRHEAVSRDNYREGSEQAFGEELNAHYNFADANVILSLDSDFLSPSTTGSSRYGRDFAARRRAEEGQDNFNRLYSVEVTPTVTGAKADHRWSVRPHEIYPIALEVARLVGVAGIPAQDLNGGFKQYAKVIADDLRANRGNSLVMAGEFQPAELHGLVHSINSALGNIGSTVLFTDAIEESKGVRPFSELVQSMESEAVDVLLILGGNPSYTAPADLSFDEALKKVGFSVHLSSHHDETCKNVSWHIPMAHYLEAWGDARTVDGSASIVQPLIAPLYNGKTESEILAAALGDDKATSYKIVRAYWKGELGGDFESKWRRAVHDGVIAGSGLSSKRPSARRQAWVNALLAPRGEFEVVFRPDPTIWDGRYANNGWLQELGKPLTKVTWDNVVYISPKLMKEKGWKNGQVLELVHGERTIAGAAWALPGQPHGVLTIHLGYGRTAGGAMAVGAGFDAYALRTGASWRLDNIEVRPTSKSESIACTQTHDNMEGREPVRAATVSAFKANPNVVASHHDAVHVEGKQAEQGRPFEDKDYAWGMAIDLSACNGCNACVVGCQAENNISVVGKDQVIRERELAWLRIDRYYEGDSENPETHFQPVPCMHCENAPCEVVCPVGATTHTPEGINGMTYNRCIGTKYCSNNCPYKVRRFNFYHYADVDTPVLQLGRNPDVTVRSRGVMEKCTYCVQRVNSARIDSKKEDRLIKDGEIKTACQTACSADAIVFGNIKDPESRVSKLKKLQQNYGLLEELGVRPRTTYLAKLTNPNPALVLHGGSDASDGGAH